MQCLHPSGAGLKQHHFLIYACAQHPLDSQTSMPAVCLAAWLVFMGIFTYFLVPETKGIPIEAIEDKFRQHWFWGKVMRRHDRRHEGPITSGDVYNDLGKNGSTGGVAPVKQAVVENQADNDLRQADRRI